MICYILVRLFFSVFTDVFPIYDTLYSGTLILAGTYWYICPLLMIYGLTMDGPIYLLFFIHVWILFIHV